MGNLDDKPSPTGNVPEPSSGIGGPSVRIVAREARHGGAVGRKRGATSVRETILIIVPRGTSCKMEWKN